MVSQQHHDMILIAYFDERNEDPHERFAQLSGMTRQEAKRVWLEWGFLHPTIQRLNEASRAAFQAGLATGRARARRGIN